MPISELGVTAEDRNRVAEYCKHWNSSVKEVATAGIRDECSTDYYRARLRIAAAVECFEVEAGGINAAIDLAWALHNAGRPLDAIGVLSTHTLARLECDSVEDSPAFHAGWILVENGAPAAALVWYREALSSLRHCDAGPVHAHIAVAQHALHEFDAASSSYGSAIRAAREFAIEYQCEVRQATIDTLERMRSACERLEVLPEDLVLGLAGFSI